VRTDRVCQRCGKKHLSEFIWLELDTDTGLFYEPGQLPADAYSQGLFPFGKHCAEKAKAAQKERVA
jgi:hypothetical protein